MTACDARPGSFVAGLGLSVFVGSLIASGLLGIGTVIAILAGSPWGWVALAAQVLLSWLPLGSAAPAPAVPFIRWCCAASASYFPVKLLMDDPTSLSPDKPYVIALEPHSSLPSAIPAAFGVESTILPPALHGRCHALASSICFQVPLVRHLYHWWGFRPIDRPSFLALLRAGKAVVLVPGGVQECLFMDRGTELAYVRRRRGFVRLALREGAPIVPVFAFGQSRVYGWLRPGPPIVPRALLERVCRRIGMVPLVMYGRWGSPLPNPVPMTVVMGAPIQVPHDPAPDDTLVQRYLDLYVEALETLFERHKAAAGYPDLQLRIL